MLDAATVAVSVMLLPTFDEVWLDLSESVGICRMTCVREADVLGELVASPVKAAVIVCAPSVRSEVANAAVLAAFVADVPISVVPSKKRTLPDGAAPAPDTLAVKVTTDPTAVGLLLEVTTVDVGSSASTSPERLSSEALLAAFE